MKYGIYFREKTIDVAQNTIHRIFNAGKPSLVNDLRNYLPKLDIKFEKTEEYSIEFGLLDDLELELIKVYMGGIGHANRSKKDELKHFIEMNFEDKETPLNIILNDFLSETTSSDVLKLLKENM